MADSEKSRKDAEPEDGLVIEVHLEASRPAADLEALRRGLESTPRRIPSKYFYDERGSRLFERITALPEYYLTRAERELLERSADEIARRTRAEELVELGSGAATKTRILLDAMRRAGRLRLYVPFDVSESEVRRVARALAAEYPGLKIHGMVADFAHHMDAIPEGKPRLVALLGSTIGNYETARAEAFLRSVSDRMSPGDWFLLGVDLIKDARRLEAAYDDDAGITAEFNRNILRVVNRVAGGDFRPEWFAHRAPFNRRRSWIEMRLVAERAMRVELSGIGLVLELRPGEEILTEISAKYDRPRVESLLTAAGFRLDRWFAHRENLFALALARKPSR